MIFFIKLLLAHIVGDFILQPDSWVLEKTRKKIRSKRTYLHALIHGVLAFLIIWDISFFLPAILIMLSHLIIDISRQYIVFGKSLHAFIVDQLLHLAVIAGISFWWLDINPLKAISFGNTTVLYLTASFIVSFPAAILVKLSIARWFPYDHQNKDQSLNRAGRFIGILERLFVLVFVLAGRWEGIGFLIAAKSIFRFSDLKEKSNYKLTEYFLIGTLLSIGIALLTGLLVLYIQNIV